MIYQLLTKLDKKFHFEKARAHCDIPCGIYDPSTAQIAALTVVRMMDLMAGLAEAGMIFVPSTDGLSHCPQEYSRIEDIALASEILLAAVIELAN